MRSSLSVLLFFLACLVASSRAEIPQRAYIWQRAWTPALRRSVQAHGAAFAALDILVAEISFTPGGQPILAQVAPDFTSLPATTPLAIVVRSAASLDAHRAASENFVLQTCLDTIRAARAAGANVRELQLDCDVPTRDLANYAAFVHILSEACRPLPVVITVLPTWMTSSEFPTLIAQPASYVLQVHSLERPRSPDESFILCDPVQARRWAAEAARFRRPFRVALPTYGYRIGFDRTGKFLGLEAEGESRRWPPDTQRRIATADPIALGALVLEWQATPPVYCEAIEWFRFPVDEQDELTWPWVTLDAVLHGRSPHGLPTLTLVANAAGLIELTLENLGDAPIAPPGFPLSWSSARLLAADAVDGWRIERRGPHAAELWPPAVAPRPLRPGEKRAIGWMRLDGADRIVPHSAGP